MRTRTVTVDGERFTVTRRAGQAVYDFVWESGPNPGYGFTTAVHGASGLTEAQLADSAREFLAQVDPRTGHIE